MSPETQDFYDLGHEILEGSLTGHRPKKQLSVEDEKLFKAFQANLLSLISHELRTPLTGILNSLSLLDEGELFNELSAKELVSMAHRNAKRLHETLASLLDLAALESGTFHARLREVDLTRLVNARIQENLEIIRERSVDVNVSLSSEGGSEEYAAVLGDPQKLSRAIDLVFQVIAPRIDRESELSIEISPTQASFEFRLDPEQSESWEMMWTQAMIAHQAGVVSPQSAFGGTLQSEREFLTRTEEGLGGELTLVREILRIHRGKFWSEKKGKKVVLFLTLPELSSLEGLRAVLLSRVFETSTGVGSVAVALIEVPAKTALKSFRMQIRKCLFRSSDAVYALPKENQIALVLNDCKKGDAPALLKRLQEKLSSRFRFGVATCPDEAADPDLLIEIANRRLFS